MFHVPFTNTSVGKGSFLQRRSKIAENWSCWAVLWRTSWKAHRILSGHNHQAISACELRIDGTPQIPTPTSADLQWRPARDPPISNISRLGVPRTWPRWSPGTYGFPTGDLDTLTFVYGPLNVTLFHQFNFLQLNFSTICLPKPKQLGATHAQVSDLTNTELSLPPTQSTDYTNLLHQQHNDGGQSKIRQDRIPALEYPSRGQGDLQGLTDLPTGDLYTPNSAELPKSSGITTKSSARMPGPNVNTGRDTRTNFRLLQHRKSDSTNTEL